MSESCFKGVAFGIESLTNQSLAKTSGEDYKKNCLELLSCCNKLGLNCSSYYLVPLKYQNKESVIEEIKLLQSYGRVEIMFLTPFPGTALWDEANQDLLTRDFFLFDSQHIVYNPSTISLKDLIWVYRYTVKQNRRHLAIN
jgi:radical SAM superfamily enzyme YgiQ (UPF0313 family)